ncbi:MAG: protease modulator HflC [Deltaproteobacteria bacterium]|nr:protease modulator HflC [Deltaproteobacteria bacterium]MBW2322411.1 protease modulator HflC [Deltaproteobacteria bacterium]
MGKKFGIIVVIIVVALIAVSAIFYTVDETKQAIILQLGKPTGGIKGPGLHLKIPFIQEVKFFESRLLDYDAAPAEILTADKKNLVVDNYAKWEIIDPLQFYKTVRNVQGALARLDDIIYAELRVELGRHIMIDIITKVRADIMAKVTERSNTKAKEYGISVKDVRIKRADLPQENERAVFGRMRAERERQAKKYRSEGQEASIKVKAAADREQTVILAEAYRKSQTLKGEGDAKATRIYAEAYNKDEEFYDFTRSLEAYRKALESDTTMVLTQGDEFLKYIKKVTP